MPETAPTSKKRLGVGFIGSGFITRFHMQSWQAIRDADILGVWSPNPEHAADAAGYARKLGVGEARAFASIQEMVEAPEIDAVWICGPNHERVANMEAIVDSVSSGRGELIGVACEKPLARNAKEALRMVELAKSVDLLDGYLENQVFSPAVVKGRELAWSRGAKRGGRPYLARAAEEHSGPHNAWFWQGDLQGGGVLNDMMCHSLEAALFLLTEPGKGRETLLPKRISAQIHCLKWQRPAYVEQLRGRYGSAVDYRKSPAEDFARVMLELEDESGEPLIIEATTSWSFVGAGLRLSMELLGPEYSMQANSLDTELSLFFSRELAQKTGEDLVEKQNAEMGLMPVVANESSTYGYDAENRHMVQSFLARERPRETFEDGLAVARLLMAAYMSAERSQTLEYPPQGLDAYIPPVARGEWNPRDT